MSKDRIKSYILLLIVAAIWGIAGPVIKFALPEFPPFIFLTYRFLISSLILIPVYLTLKPNFPRSKREIFILFIVGFLGSTINLALTFYGFELTTVLDAIIIGNTAPLFVIAGGVIFLKEKISKNEIIGIIIAFIGTLTVILEPGMSNGNGSNRVIGNFIMILANLSWVFYILLSKKEIRHRIDTLTITTVMFVVGFITSLPIAIFQSKGVLNLFYNISMAPISAHLAVWYLAVLSGALAYFLYQEGQKKIEASEAALFGYLSPLFAAPLAIFWLKEKLTIPFIIGSVIISIGVFIAESRKSTGH